MQHTILHYTTTFYTKLQCNILYYTTMQHFILHYNATYYTTLQCNILYYTTMQHTTLQCNILYYTTMQYTILQCNMLYYITMQHTILHYNATYYTTLQCNTLYLTTIQRTILRYNAIQSNAIRQYASQSSRAAIPYYTIRHSTRTILYSTTQLHGTFFIGGGGGHRLHGSQHDDRSNFLSYSHLTSKVVTASWIWSVAWQSAR